MQYKAMIKRLASVCFAAVLVFSAAAAGPFSAYGAGSSSSVSDLEKEKKNLQDKIDANKKKLESLQGQESTSQELVNALVEKVSLVEQQIAVMEEKIAPVQAAITALEEKIATAQSSIAKLEEEIPAKQKEYDKKLKEYASRMRAMYVSGNVSELEVVLGASDASSLLTRMEMLKKIVDEDSNTQEELTKEMEKLEKQKKELSDSKAALESDKTEFLAQKASLEDQKAEIVASKNDLEKQRASANASLQRLHDQTGEYSELIDDDQDTLKAIQKKIDKAIDDANKNPPVITDPGNGSGSGSGGSGSGGGGSGSGGGSVTPPKPTGIFTHPCPNYTRISARYPGYSDGRYHSGTDFAAPYGTSIYAADNGYVFLCENLGGSSYGRYLIIKHRDGLYTLYAHTSAVVVSVGQVVTRGQKIAEVGSTGNSSGNHLHFEVRTGAGRYANCVDPADYINY